MILFILLTLIQRCLGVNNVVTTSKQRRNNVVCLLMVTIDRLISVEEQIPINNIAGSSYVEFEAYRDRIGFPTGLITAAICRELYVTANRIVKTH